VPISPGAIASAAGLTFWGFLGLESATVPADKVENADRVVPRATLIGVALAGLSTWAFRWPSPPICPPDAAASPAPVAELLRGVRRRHFRHRGRVCRDQRVRHAQRLYPGAGRSALGHGARRRVPAWFAKETSPARRSARIVVSACC
jgi:hypothetical protein